jgi:hypothetical protein
MKRAWLLVLALPALDAQTPARLAAAHLAPAPLPVARIPQGMLANLEQIVDGRLLELDPKDPIDMLGSTRGLYLPGYGTVFTTQVSLVVSPGNFPIARPTFTPEIRESVHQRKIAQLPKLEGLMKEMVKITALTLVPMPDDQKVVMAVRLRYLPDEDTTGLPSQIVVSADKKSAALGDIKTEIE